MKVRLKKLSLHPSSLRPSSLFLLPSRLEDAVEGRLRGTPELSEARAVGDLAQGLFGRDRAERGAAERERVRGATEGRGRRERAADDVEVLLHRVARHRLDDERAAFVRE